MFGFAFVTTYGIFRSVVILLNLDEIFDINA
jgi:hypothetical protein